MKEDITLRGFGLLAGLLMGSLAAIAWGGEFEEFFDAPPESSGWQIHGDSSLFAWNPENGEMRVTWDSDRENSFFYRPTGIPLNRRDSFEVEFDLAVEFVDVALKPGAPYAFEIAMGWIHTAHAFSPEFRRGTGSDSPDLVELDYFPDTGFGATLSPVVSTSSGRLLPTFNFPVPLPVGETMHIRLKYSAGAQELTAEVASAGEPLAELQPVRLQPYGDTLDFTVDAFAISSYADHDSSGRIHAVARLDNLSWHLPDPPRIHLTLHPTPEGPNLEFLGVPNWHHRIERSEDLRHWVPVSPAFTPNAEIITWKETASPAPTGFYYRVNSWKSNTEPPEEGL